MKSYNFRQCSLEILEKLLGIEETDTLEALDAWISGRHNIVVSDFEKRSIENMQHYMKRNIRAWNEQELALNFIGPLMSFVTFSSKKYNLFAERPLDATIKDINGDDVNLSGRPDTIVASGFRSPEVPFFSFHEHKPEVDSSGDPTGQVLAAMLVGQAKNGNPDDPIYGCYVIGQNWYFLVLVGKFYTIATPFATTNDEVFDVFKMLKTLKMIIEERVK
jgi:hypothetical protein